MKEQINERFIEAVSYILEHNKAKNKNAIAIELDISKSKFSEIINRRMNVGVEVIVLLYEKFNISPNWILLNRGAIEVNDYKSNEYYNLLKEIKNMTKNIS